MADENKRMFTEEQLRASEGQLNLQMGFNKGASQAGHGGFGNTRHMQIYVKAEQLFIVISRYKSINQKGNEKDNEGTEAKLFDKRVHSILQIQQQTISQTFYIKHLHDNEQD